LSNDDSGRAPRVEATFRVSYANVDQLLVAYSSDLSKGGMFLATEQFLPVNAVIRVNLELGEGSAEIPIICRVVYVRDHAASRGVGKPPGMGIEFLDLTVDCLGLIEAYIAERISDGEVAPEATPARRLSVVIADDDHGCRTLAAAPFRQRGDYVRIAPDGFEALAQCLKETPDVIVSDVHMPRMDGWQLLRMCRARPTLSSVPFLFLTTLGGEQERLRGYQLGVDDYVAKPFRGKELQARVDRVVARVHRAPHALAAQKTLRGDLGQVSLPSVLVNEALTALLDALELRLAEPPERVLEAWRERDALRGQRVQWEGNEGIAAGVSDSGALLVETDSGRVELDAGEVHLG